MISLPFALLLLVNTFAADRVAISDLFEVDGKEMIFEIYASHVDNSMNWNENAPNPPLAVREAIRKSRDILELYARKKLIRGDVSWTLKEAVLQSVNAETFSYRIVYHHVGLRAEVNILILMDGRWIVPKENKAISDDSK